MGDSTKGRVLTLHPTSSGVGTALLAVLMVSIAFALEGRLFINFADEGFLWYGTWRTSLGEVPIRDFQAYDPGRYYWGALWFLFFGDGIVALRLSNAIFQCIGMVAGLLVLRRLSRRLDFVLLSGLILLVWMYPRHKLIDIGIALIATYMVVWIFDRPSLRRHLAAGLFVGVAAFFGLNHGLYTSVALGLAILYSWLQQDGPPCAQRFLSFGAGILVGFSPMLLMLIFVPGFSESALDRIVTMMEFGSTNVDQPIPWPWRVWSSPPPYLKVHNLGATAGFVAGSFYVVWFAFLGAMGLHFLRDRQALTPERAVLLAAALVSFPYLHHATARAGISHLSQAIHPLLIGLIAAGVVFAKARPRYVLSASMLALALGSAIAIVPLSPLSLRLTGQQSFFEWTPIGEDSILLRKDRAKAIKKAEEISETLIAPDESVFIAPRLPTYYAIMQRRAPVKQLYYSVKESLTKQAEVIRELEDQKVRWAIIGTAALDGSESLRFPNTHPAIWDYLAQNFRAAEGEGVEKGDIFFDGYILLERKAAKDTTKGPEPF